MSKKIVVRHVSKVYNTINKEPGLKGSIKGLFKKIVEKKVAVNNFNLEINEGEIVGLIGPNGAGKTTLIKMLIGVIHPSSGELSVFDYTPSDLKDEFKKSYAVVMGQKSQLWWDLPAIDSFLLNKELYDIEDDDFKKVMDELVDLLGCRELLNVQVRNLSLGERMKMELIIALLHHPRILFLDEPTIGLDAVSQRQIREFLKKINETLGVTILLTSHYMKDIEFLCDRAVLIRKGEKIYDGSLDYIIKENQEHKTITVSFDPMPTELMKGDYEWIKKENNTWVVKVRKEEAKKFITEVMEKNDVLDISIEEEGLEDIIEKIYVNQEKEMS